jgi:hypothetical protein
VPSTRSIGAWKKGGDVPWSFLCAILPVYYRVVGTIDGCCRGMKEVDNEGTSYRAADTLAGRS